MRAGLRRVRRGLAIVVRMRPQDLVEVVVQLVVLTRIELGLRRTPLPALAGRLRLPLGADVVGRAPTAMTEPLPAWALRRLYYTNRVVGVWPFGQTCLRRCLLGGHRLRPLAPTLRVGVKRAGDDPKLSAHSWLEIDGRFFDPEASQYLALELR